jgi:NADPH:quinone reductase-like Zn-dependent oxidoreductase
MKAIICTRYGPPEVLQQVEANMPSPKDDEVLIKVRATTVTPSDCAFRSGKPFISRFFVGLRRPKHIPGDVLAGEIEAVGKNVRRFKVGDRVYGSSGTSFGSQAAYTSLSEDEALAPMAVNASFEEAAAISDGGLTALPFLRDRGGIKSGHKVLINGASGSIGTIAVQLAKHFGAEVTGVCSTSNLEMVRSLGADKVIDYTKEDFTKSGEAYDIIFDAVGKSSFARCKGSLRTGGIYLTTLPTTSVLVRMLWPLGPSRKKACFVATGLRPPSEKARDLAILNGLVEAGKLRAVIDQRYPMEEIVEAHRYVEKGHKKGNVVINLELTKPLHQGA